jgi:tetratricopeptide (TPR) repeat protein
LKNGQKRALIIKLGFILVQQLPMTANHAPGRIQESIMFLLFLLLISINVVAQKSKADSLLRSLALEKSDTSRIRLLWQLAGAMDDYRPDTALIISQQALYLSKEIKYTEGESKSLGALANTLVKIGNYPRALELYFQKLQLEEQRNMPYNLASVLINLGVVNVLQEDYGKALKYYSQADSVIKLHKVNGLEYYIRLNLGDIYNRLNRSDSAYHYFNQSLHLAEALKDVGLMGTSMTGLGHTYLKLGNYEKSKLNYQMAIKYLTEANDNEILCEASLGIGELYQHLNRQDSARIYGIISLETSKRGGFLQHQFEAAQFLSNVYGQERRLDSAFVYATHVNEINDSLNSKARIRESQILSTNEQLRQLEIAENKRIEAKERFKRLQLLFIGLFIPGFFLLTLSLSRISINSRVLRALGVLSILILFEYLTLLLHPYVAELTHHTPVYEMLIFVAIAAVLIPTHHRIEHWLIHKLIRNGSLRQKLKLKLKLVKNQPVVSQSDAAD